MVILRIPCAGSICDRQNSTNSSYVTCSVVCRARAQERKSARGQEGTTRVSNQCGNEEGLLMTAACAAYWGGEGGGEVQRSRRKLVRVHGTKGLHPRARPGHHLVLRLSTAVAGGGVRVDDPKALHAPPLRRVLPALGLCSVLIHTARYMNGWGGGRWGERWGEREAASLALPYVYNRWGRTNVNAFGAKLIARRGLPWNKALKAVPPLTTH